MAGERTGLRSVECPASTLPGLVWTIVIVLVVAVAGGLALLSRIPASGESEFWKKVDHLAQLRKDAPFDAVFVGHSIPLCALDPEEVGRASGGLKTYNASLSTMFLGGARMWMSEFVVPNLRPRYVVLGLLGAECNPHSTRVRFIEKYLTAQDARARFVLGGVLTRARLLCTRPELVRYLLRRLAGRASEPLPPPRDRSQLGPFGDERKHNDRQLHTTQQLHEALRDGIFTTYEFSEAELGKLREFVGAMRKLEAEVIVLRLVTMPNAVDYYPNGEADHLAAWSRIQAELDVLSVPLVEVDPSPFDETCFSDVMHMNGRGKQIYSRQIGEALAAHLGAEHSSR